MEKLRRDVSDKGISDKEILDSNVERRDVSGRVILDNKVEKSEVSGKSKTFCSNCKVHCYKPAMRERIKEVEK